VPRPPKLARALASLFLRGEAGEVIAGDLDQEFADAVNAGTPVRAAGRRYWRQALASIAAVRRHQQETHVSTQRSPFQWLHGLSLDVKSVARVLRRSPGYAAIAILSLAIGIGANTAIVSVVRQLLMQPLPVERPDELRLVYWRPDPADQLGISQRNSSGFRGQRSNYNFDEFVAMRSAVDDTADLAGFTTINQLTAAVPAVDGAAPVSGAGMLVSGNFFDTVRPPMAIGRGLTAADDTVGAPLVGVLGFRLWSQFFGESPDVIGKTIRINGTPVEIVGVTSGRYRGLSPGGFQPYIDITMALSQQPVVAPEWNDPGPLMTDPQIHWLREIARVPAGNDAAVANALTAAFNSASSASGLTREQSAKVTASLLPGRRGFDSLRTSTAQPLRILSVVVGVVLIIACINVAGLMLARGVSRQKELTLRRALGAGRARIMRELLIESFVLSLAGGIAGLLLAVAAAPLLKNLLTSGLGTTDVSIAMDWTLLATTAAIACGTGLVAGLIPAIRFSRNDGAMLKDRGGVGAPKLLIGRALLALQIAVSLPLVVGAGLFLKTLYNLTTIDVGFNPDGLVLFAMDPTMNGKRPERNAVVFPQVLDRIEQIPGVSSATLIENALVSGWESDSRITVGDHTGVMFMNRVGPRFLDTMGIRIIDGRGIDAADRPGRPNAVVLNQTAVKEFFPGGSPIGQHFKNGNRELEVVGVFADTKYDGLRSAIPSTMLQSYAQASMTSMFVVVRSSVPPADLRREIERAIRDIDPALPITKFKTQQAQINETIGKERVFVQLLTVFGAFALLLACVGLHGVTSYSVTRRTGEIGIRLALGAQRSQVLWMILRQVVVLAAIGLALGLPLAWLAGPAVSAFLFGLKANDPVTLFASALVMVGVAVGAGVWPARRAARMEALTALRTE